MKPRYRLVVLDIDGTLLNSRRHVDERVRCAIRRALDAGVHVTLATGRRLWSVKPIVADLGIQLPIILYSGALVWDTATQTALYQRPLAPALVREAIAVICEFGAQVIAFQSPLYDTAENLIFGSEVNDDEVSREYANGRIQRVVRMSYDEIEQLQDVIYLAVVSSEERVRAIYERLGTTGAYTLQVGINNPTMDPPWHAVNIYSAGVSKANALEHLAGLYELSLSETMAVGDGNNDLELIVAAGLGVAMGNARPHLKEAADVVVGSNDEDGAAEAIERYVLDVPDESAAR